jgi:hypothetical protein
LGCFVKNSSPFHVCLDSTCETDQQCDEGFSCVPLKGRLVVKAGPTRAKLDAFLLENARGTLLIHVDEAKILEKTKQLRAAFKMPEDLSGGAP